MARERTLWLLKGVGGILLVGFGLCVFGEALARKITGQGGWVWIGGASLAIFNFGLCMMFDSQKHQARSRHR